MKTHKNGKNGRKPWLFVILGFAIAVILTVILLTMTHAALADSGHETFLELLQHAQVAMIELFIGALTAMFALIRE